MKQKEILLSKWWKTKSARAAFRRVEKQKKERIKKMKAAFAEKRRRRSITKPAPSTL